MLHFYFRKPAHVAAPVVVTMAAQLWNSALLKILMMVEIRVKFRYKQNILCLLFRLYKVSIDSSSVHILLFKTTNTQDFCRWYDFMHVWWLV
jgi:hypothetical protein